MHYQHDLLVHGSTDELAAVAEPFLRAGLAAGETAIIAIDQPGSAVLLDALGTEEGVVVLERQGLYGQRTPTAITSLRKLVQRHSSHAVPRVRVVGETDFGPTPRDWRGGGGHEAVLNEAPAPPPPWGVCVFDNRRRPHPGLSPRLR